MIYIIFSFLLLLAYPSWAVDRYVTKGGNAGCNTSTSSNGMPTIQDGFNCLLPGDTLFIGAGTYDEQVSQNLGHYIPSGTSSSPIRIRNIPGQANPVWRLHYAGTTGIDSALHLKGAAWLIFENMIWDGVNQTRGTLAIDGAQYITAPGGPQSHDILFLNCEVRQSHGEVGVGHSYNITFRGGSVHDCCDDSSPGNLGYRHCFYPGADNLNITFEDMHIYNCGYGAGIHTYGGDEGGSGEHGSDGFVIRNNIIENTGASPGCQAAIVASNHENIQIYNNVLSSNSSCAPGINIHFGPNSGFYIYNNTFVGNGNTALDLNGNPIGVVSVRQGNDIRVRNNIFFGNYTSTPVGGEASGNVLESNNFTENPNFLDPSLKNYHLQPNSGAINYGVAGTGIPTTDLEGNNREGNPDAGAYEYITGVSPITGNYYMATAAAGGSDARSCDDTRENPGQPMETLTKVIPCMGPSSTLHVRQGTYAQKFSTGITALASGTITSPTTIRSFSGEVATFTGTGDGTFIWHMDSGNNYVLQDLVLDGNNTACRGYQLTSGTSNVRITGGEVREVTCQSILVQGTSGMVVENVIVRDSPSTEAVLAFENTAGAIIRQNTVDSNGGNAVRILGGATNTLIERNIIRRHSSGSGIATSNTINTRSINNIIDRNGLRGIEIRSGDDGHQAINNTVWNNTGIGIEALSGAINTVVQNNIADLNTGGHIVLAVGTGIEDHNVVTSPSFIAPGPPSNFHVEGSNVIWMGVTSSIVTVDFAGKARLPGKNTIGAFQDDVVAALPGTPARVPPFGSTGFLALP